MGIQQNINSILGSATAAAGLGKIASNQKKQLQQNELKLDADIAKAKGEVGEAEFKLDTNTLSNLLETGVANEKDIDPALHKKLEDATRNYEQSISDYHNLSGFRADIDKGLSENMSMAKKAFEKARDAIESRKMLKSNLESRQLKLQELKQLKALGGKK